MKQKILILEDNYYTFFTAKQLIESQLKVDCDAVKPETQAELVESARDLRPTVVICRPQGGVVGLLEMLRQRGINRRNATVTFLVTHEMDQREMNRLSLSMEGLRRMFGSCVAKAA